MAHDDILAVLDAKRDADARWQDGRTFGMVFDGGPEVHAVAEAVAQRCSCTRTRSNTARVPESRRDPVRGRRRVRRAVPRRARRGRVHDVGRHREHPDGGEGRARAGAAERGVTEPEMVDRRQRARRVPQGRALLRRARAQGAGAAPTTAPTSTRWPRASTTTRSLVVGSAPQYPQGVIDPIPELAGARGIGRRVDARRRVHGRLRAAVHGDERRRRSRRGTSASPA